MVLFNDAIRLLGTVTCLLLANANALNKSSGCGKELGSDIMQGGTGDSNNLTITSSGLKRTYLLHIPEEYTPTNGHGLIFSFHGRSCTGASQESLSHFSSHAYNPNMLVVYPDGIDNEWQGDPDNYGDPPKVNDVQFVLDLIDDIKSEYCIDEDRIFSTGMSNGGGFSLSILACDPVASTKFAAFAAESGAYYQGTTDADCDGATVPIACSPGRKPVPILEIHGSDDDTIPYSGGGRRGRCLPSVPHFMTEWAERNGLPTTNHSSSLYSDDVVKYQFGTGSLEGVNTHYRVSSLGHDWASEFGAGNFNSTPLMYNFFVKYNLDNTALPEVSPTATSSSSKSTASPTKSTTTSPSKSSSVTEDTSPSVTATVTSLACPAVNNTVYNANFDSYFFLCGFDSTPSFFGKPIPYVGGFGKCIGACDATDGCQHVVVYDGTCYVTKVLKKYIATSNKKMGVAVQLQ